MFETFAILFRVLTLLTRCPSNDYPNAHVDNHPRRQAVERRHNHHGCQ
jgi:hypothetical protein